MFYMDHTEHVLYGPYSIEHVASAAYYHYGFCGCLFDRPFFAKTALRSVRWWNVCYMFDHYCHWKSDHDHDNRSIDRSIYRSIDLSIDQSINRSIELSIYQSIDISIDQSIDLSIYRSILQSIDLSLDRSIDLSINLSIYQYINLSITPQDGSVIHSRLLYFAGACERSPRA